MAYRKILPHLWRSSCLIRSSCRHRPAWCRRSHWFCPGWFPPLRRRLYNYRSRPQFIHDIQSKSKLHVLKNHKPSLSSWTSVIASRCWRWGGGSFWCRRLNSARINEDEDDGSCDENSNHFASFWRLLEFLAGERLMMLYHWVWHLLYGNRAERNPRHMTIFETFAWNVFQRKVIRFE